MLSDPGNLQNLTPVTFSEPQTSKNKYLLRKTKVSDPGNLQNITPVTFSEPRTSKNQYFH